jgi:hypothetical protein
MQWFKFVVKVICLISSTVTPSTIGNHGCYLFATFLDTFRTFWQKVGRDAIAETAYCAATSRHCAQCALALSLSAPCLPYQLPAFLQSDGELALPTEVFGRRNWPGKAYFQGIAVSQVLWAVRTMSLLVARGEFEFFVNAAPHSTCSHGQSAQTNACQTLGQESDLSRVHCAFPSQHSWYGNLPEERRSSCERLAGHMVSAYERLSFTDSLANFDIVFGVFGSF